MTAQSEKRLVIAPDGMAWVDGYDRFAGEWEVVTEAATMYDQSLVHYGQDDGNTGWKVVTIPADEPARKADLVKLAAEVAELREDNQWLRGTLQMMASGIGTYLDPRRGDPTRFSEADTG